MRSIIKCETEQAMYITACKRCGGPIAYTAVPGWRRLIHTEPDRKAEHSYVCGLRQSRKDTFLRPDGTVDLDSLSTVYGESIAQKVAEALADGKPGTLPFPRTRAQIVAALPCSHCRAPAGSPCKNKDGQQRKRVHDARMSAARREAIDSLYGM